MPKNEKIVIGAVVIAGIVFVLWQMKSPNSKLSLTPQVDNSPQIQAEKSFTDFPNWKKQANFQSIFNFYLPDSVEVKTVNVDTKFQLVSTQKADQPLIMVDKLSYADFQKNKMELDKQGEQQFGWTNAYGASVFEYKKDVLTTFVVDKEKKSVLKFLTTDAKNFSLQDNIVRTIQTTAKETDLHGPWYVNFPGGYKLRYTSDLELRTDSPFAENVRWDLKLKDTSKTGHIQIGVWNSYPDGGLSNYVTKKIKVDGVEAEMYQYEDEESGVFWQKDNRYFLLKASGNSKQTNQIENNLMMQMTTSFRFLTDQEKME